MKERKVEERSGGTFLRSTTERMEKQILSFDRLRTGALLRMTKRESGRGKEGPHEMRRVRMQKK